MTAPEGTTQILDASTAEDLERRFLAAWNSHSADQLTALAQPDVLWEDPSIPGGHLVGHAALTEWLQSIWRAAPDFTVAANGPLHLASDGRSVMIEWTGSGTFTGPMAPPGLAPTGQQLRLSGVDRYWFRDGRLSHVRTVMDMMSLARQIGASPAEGSRAEKLTVAMQRLAARRIRRKAVRH